MGNIMKSIVTVFLILLFSRGLFAELKLPDVSVNMAFQFVLSQDALKKYYPYGGIGGIDISYLIKERHRIAIGINYNTISYNFFSHAARTDQTLRRNYYMISEDILIKYNFDFFDTRKAYTPNFSFLFGISNILEWGIPYGITEEYFESFYKISETSPNIGKTLFLGGGFLGITTRFKKRKIYNKLSSSFGVGLLLRMQDRDTYILSFPVQLSFTFLH